MQFSDGRAANVEEQAKGPVLNPVEMAMPSPVDRFIAGEGSALDDVQLAGLQTFLETGCTTCHQGVGVGGGMYQKLGLVRPYPTKDEGRAAHTKNPVDKGFFKVPSLRNVAKTGPYFHDGGHKTLDDAIRTMGAVQLGRDLDDAQIASIRTFLESLTGTVDTAYVAAPDLPESGPKTPKPDPS